MSKYKNILVSILMISGLLTGGTASNSVVNSNNQNSENKYNIFQLDLSKAEEIRTSLKLVEEEISKLPSVNEITLNDKNLLEDAKKLIKDFRALEVALVIKDENHIKDLEKQLVTLSKINNKDDQDIENADLSTDDKPESSKPIFNESVAPTKPKDKVITYDEITTYQNIDFETRYVDDPNLAKGSNYVQTDGQAGQRTIISKVKYADGIEVSREVISSVISRDVINKVVVVGSKVSYIDTTGNTGAMFNEINASRSNAGVAGLSRSSRLDAAASVRVKEIVEVFSHTRPNGSAFYTVDYDAVDGENIAYGNADATITHGRFMNSQGHKDNILRTTYKSVGLSSYTKPGGPTYWVVLFSRN